jgi:hypothetical protein
MVMNGLGWVESLFSKVRQAHTGDFDLSKYPKNRWLGMKQQPGPGLTMALCIHLSAMEQHNNHCIRKIP